MDTVLDCNAGIPTDCEPAHRMIVVQVPTMAPEVSLSHAIMALMTDEMFDGLGPTRRALTLRFLADLM